MKCDICGQEPAKKHICNDTYCREHYDDHVCDEDGTDDWNEWPSFDDVEEEKEED